MLLTHALLKRTHLVNGMARQCWDASTSSNRAPWLLHTPPSKSRPQGGQQKQQWRQQTTNEKQK
eukprot:2752255-Amphidinium_carterae.1